MLDKAEAERQLVAAMRLTGFPTHGDNLRTMSQYPWQQVFGLLNDGETIQRVIFGQDSRFARTAILAATDLRVVRVSDGVSALYYEDVLDVTVAEGRFVPLGTFSVTGRVATLRVDKCANGFLQPMKAFVEQQMRKARLGHGQVARVVVQNPIATTDLATQIQRLADLRQQGVLTEPEFQAAKQKLLR
jgi:Short C-terminal domain